MSEALESSLFYNDFRVVLSQNEEVFGPWSGVIFRSVSPRYAQPHDILSGYGSYKSGGRWNAPGIYAIYGSLEPGLAADESFVFQLAEPRRENAGADPFPGMLERLEAARTPREVSQEDQGPLVAEQPRRGGHGTHWIIHLCLLSYRSV